MYKRKNKKYNDLTKQENDLPRTPVFISEAIDNTEEELKEEIVNEIVRDRFL
jgi:ribonuclease HIII